MVQSFSTYYDNTYVLFLLSSISAYAVLNFGSGNCFNLDGDNAADDDHRYQTSFWNSISRKVPNKNCSII